jgi:hypothetical protein
MAKTILNAAYFACAATGVSPLVDLSDHVRSVSMEMTTDIIDATCMTDTYKDKLPGMTDWKVSVEFAQDYATGKVDDTLFGLQGSLVDIEVRPTQAAAGVGNPVFTGTAIMSNYSPLDGKVSDLNTNKVTFEGTATLTRDATS